MTMAIADSHSWQPSLFEVSLPDLDLHFDHLLRHQLDDAAWVDHIPGWSSGADVLFDWLVGRAPWHTEEIVIHARRLVQPRLLARWSCSDTDPPLPERLEAMRAALSARYGRRFDSVGANLYRDGRDSVAWHGDRIARTVRDPLVAIVSLGETRRLLLRPVGGRTALTLAPASGDLVVMGGTCQRTWQHTIPKVAAAGPRISVTFRHSTNDAA
ncbi:MAG TPA: alpha-ketoglutarate-dependent dioxygenase AlkB [Candidatus Dormibacteraeota bacterium]|nr:alpha-ketoglutarate-dependent dioxygenase AlkB [Candidatus Dormibacteraeota bacterium]